MAYGLCCLRFARNHTRTFLRFFNTKCDELKPAGLKCHEIGLLSFGASKEERKKKAKKEGKKEGRKKVRTEGGK